MSKFFDTITSSVSNESRLFAILMSFSGGALDVYSHNYFHGLVATQTGNVILLASDLSSNNWYQTLPKFLSIAAFTIGFLFATWVKEQKFSRYWRCYTILPIILSSLVIPFIPENFYLTKIGFLAFGSGLLMLTFTGVKIEGSSYTIMMTSGNYRKMLTEWYFYLTSKNRPLASNRKRSAQNYTIIVAAFIFGACFLAFINHFLGIYTIWLATLTFIFSFIIEVNEVKNHKL